MDKIKTTKFAARNGLKTSLCLEHCLSKVDVANLILEQNHNHWRLFIDALRANAFVACRVSIGIQTLRAMQGIPILSAYARYGLSSGSNQEYRFILRQEIHDNRNIETDMYFFSVGD